MHLNVNNQHPGAMGFSLRISVIPEFFTKNTHFHDQNYTLLFKIMFNENALFLQKSPTSLTLLSKSSIIKFQPPLPNVSPNNSSAAGVFQLNMFFYFYFLIKFWNSKLCDHGYPKISPARKCHCSSSMMTQDR